MRYLFLYNQGFEEKHVTSEFPEDMREKDVLAQAMRETGASGTLFRCVEVSSDAEQPTVPAENDRDSGGHYAVRHIWVPDKDNPARV